MSKCTVILYFTKCAVTPAVCTVRKRMRHDYEQEKSAYIADSHHRSSAAVADIWYSYVMLLVVDEQCRYQRLEAYMCRYVVVAAISTPTQLIDPEPVSSYRCTDKTTTVLKEFHY